MHPSVLLKRFPFLAVHPLWTSELLQGAVLVAVNPKDLCLTDVFDAVPCKLSPVPQAGPYWVLGMLVYMRENRNLPFLQCPPRDFNYIFSGVMYEGLYYTAYRRLKQILRVPSGTFELNTELWYYAANLERSER